MWIIAVVFGLAVLLILLLSVPLDLRLSLKIDDKMRFKLKLVWLFGLLKKEITGRKKKKKPAKKKMREAAKLDAGMLFAALRVKGLFRQAKRLLKDTLGLPEVKRLEADFTVGLDDPADTGLLFSYLGPAAALAAYSIPGFIKLQPSFSDEPVLKGYLCGLVRVQPLKSAVPLLRFSFSKPVFRVVKLMVIAKWKRRKKSS